MDVLTNILKIVISFIGALISPSTPEKQYFSPPTGYIETFCKFGYGFLVSTFYNLMMILTCCYYAFKARRVPSNYNESKFIALSVYSTLVFGMAAVPVYITAVYTLQKVATFCLALLLNAFLTLFCVYLPKLYAIRFDVEVELCEWKASTSVSAAVSTTVPISQ
ncbi:metabotropic glutamate receptor-like [Asterias rubens]|uniref:metabotropic glutamate receptor-like n=1 Tax=Asterias rubens TaxID=7604 RepID=UPI001454F9C0|nr:metabotropic glutamate receptor-like [Asterias rubens]